MEQSTITSYAVIKEKIYLFFMEGAIKQFHSISLFLHKKRDFISFELISSILGLALPALTRSLPSSLFFRGPAQKEKKGGRGS